MEEPKFEWADINPDAIITPKRILLEFSNSFNEKFGRKIIMNLSSAQEQSLDWDILSMVGDASNNQPSDMTHSLQLQVPELDNYTLQIIKVTHKVTAVYPCTVLQLIDDAKEECETYDALLEALKKATKSEKLLTVMANLFAQVN